MPWKLWAASLSKSCVWYSGEVGGAAASLKQSGGTQASLSYDNNTYSISLSLLCRSNKSVTSSSDKRLNIELNDDRHSTFIPFPWQLMEPPPIKLKLTSWLSQLPHKSREPMCYQFNSITRFQQKWRPVSHFGPSGFLSVIHESLSLRLSVWFWESRDKNHP